METNKLCIFSVSNRRSYNLGYIHLLFFASMHGCQGLRTFVETNLQQYNVLSRKKVRLLNFL